MEESERLRERPPEANKGFGLQLRSKPKTKSQSDLKANCEAEGLVGSHRQQDHKTFHQLIKNLLQIKL